MNNLPLPGSPDWLAWRKSGMPIERWLDERPTQDAPPAAQPTIAAPKAPGAAQTFRTQPESTSRVLDRFGGTVEVPVPGLSIGPLFGETAPTGPHPVNPEDDPGDPTRSHPSGGPIGEPIPLEFFPIERDGYPGHNRSERNAQRNAERNAQRVRRDTDTAADWTNWPGELT